MVEGEQIAPEHAKPVAERRIMMSGWPAAVVRVLRGLGVQTWGDLAALSADDLRRHADIGKGRVAFLRNQLERRGLKFSKVVRDWETYQRDRMAVYQQPDVVPAVCGVYFVRCQRFIKIGKAQNIKMRMSDLACGIPFDLDLIGFIRTEDGDAAYELEQQLHERFDALRHRGEWFRDDQILLDYIAGCERRLA